MFTVCEGCLEGGYIDCPLYACMTFDGFVIICCIVYAIEMGLSIIGIADLGEGDEENKV